MATTTTTESGAAFDLALTESQELVQRTAREFATEKLLPIAGDIDEQGKVPAAILEVLQRDLGDPKYRPAPLLRRYVQAGWLGRKSGRGFFEYAT